MKSKRLEDVVALKQEYGINSQDAFKYVKGMEFYEDLRDQVNNQIRGQPFKIKPLTLRETANFCEMLYARIDSVLHDEQVRRGVVEEKTIARVNPLHGSEEPNRVNWYLDYSPLLMNYAQSSFRKKGAELKATDEASMWVVTNPHHYFTDINGVGMNYRGLVNNLPNGEFFDKNDFLFPGEKLSSNVPMGLLEVFKGLSDGFNTKRMIDEESDFLHGRKTEKTLYERAKREETLNRLETERRIAMQEIAISSNELDFFDEGPESLFAGKVIRGTERDLLGELSKEDINEEWREKLKYSLKSIRKNKSWIKKMLGN